MDGGRGKGAGSRVLAEQNPNTETRALGRRESKQLQLQLRNWHPTVVTEMVYVWLLSKDGRISCNGMGIMDVFKGCLDGRICSKLGGRISTPATD